MKPDRTPAKNSERRVVSIFNPRRLSATAKSTPKPKTAAKASGLSNCRQKAAAPAASRRPVREKARSCLLTSRHSRTMPPALTAIAMASIGPGTKAASMMASIGAASMLNPKPVEP